MKTQFTLAASTSLALAMAAGTAVGDVVPPTDSPGIGNTTQQGSLMILPLIDTSYGKDTIVRIQNDGEATVWVECIWMNGTKARANRAFPLTAKASTTLSAVDLGFNNLDNGPLASYWKFKDSKYTGEMKCLAVKDQSNPYQITYNYLTATATVVDYAAQTAFEYNSWNFKGYFGDTPATKGLLKLGSEYDSCPEYIKFTYVKPGAYLGLGEYKLEEGADRLAVVRCTQDFRQEPTRYFTKLSFSIWDANENPLSGPNYDCTDSMRYTALNRIDHSAANFEAWDRGGNLKTDTAVVRVYGVAATKKKAPDDCWKWADAPWWIPDPLAAILPNNAKVTASGLVGVVVRPLYIPEGGGPGGVPEQMDDVDADAITAAETNTSHTPFAAGDTIKYCVTDTCLPY